ncbi:MAG: hypothetical protein AAB801_02330 [Patescibacteria group bacterium]
MNYVLRTTGLLIKSYISGFILACLLFLLFAQGAIAQIRSISISPPRIEIRSDKGGFAEGFIRVKNRGQTSLLFTTSIQDFIVKDSLGTPILLPIDSSKDRFSAASWISVFPSSFELSVNTDQNIYYSINIPANASAGGHYASLIFEPKTTVSEGNSQTTVTAGIGSLFYINVSGQIKESANVLSFSGKSFLEYGPQNLTAIIENSSDTHIYPVGKITLKDFLGREVSIKNFPSQNIFPDTIRDFEIKIGHKYMVGPYKVSFLGSYGENNNLPLSAQFTFWVIPWRIAVIITLLIILAVLILVYWKKKNSQNKIELPKAPVQEL